MQTSPASSAFAPYPTWMYLARALWVCVQATVWRLAWKKIWPLRPALLKCFGAKMPLRALISENVRVHFPWHMKMGVDVAVGPRVDFYNLDVIHIGNRVVISQDAYFCGGTHDYTKPDYPLLRKTIVIHDDVWIGAGAFVGPGVTIGQGAVVGARAVVTKDVPAWKVVAGNPARVIKDRIIKA